VHFLQVAGKNHLRNTHIRKWAVYQAAGGLSNCNFIASPPVLRKVKILLMTPGEKGHALELAVEQIETVILASSRSRLSATWPSIYTCRLGRSYLKTPSVTNALSP
jgi:hypothetical protein